MVGCGRVRPRCTSRAIARVRGARVVALADRDAARLAQLAPHCEGAATYADYRELLADERVTLVAVCVPTTLHAEVAAAAFRAGKHVFIEKPLALTLDDCDRLVGEAARAEALGVRSVVGFNLRSHRLVRQARDVIRSGVLGEIELLRTLWTADWSGAVRPVWHAVRAQGGGALLEIGAHQADLWRWLLDSEVESVHAVSRSTAFEDQTAAVQARMASGVLVSAAVSQRTTSQNVIEVFGSRGSLRLSVYHGDSFEVAAIGAKSVGAWRRIGPLVRRAAKTAGGARRGAPRRRLPAVLRPRVGATSSRHCGAARRCRPRCTTGGRPRRWCWRPCDRCSRVGGHADGCERPVAGRREGRMSAARQTPAMSVVLPTPSDFASIAATVRHLGRQTIVDRLELIVVAMDQPGFSLDHRACREFLDCRVVHVQRASHGRASAAGVRAALAPIVVFAEDHCFPEPGWADALLEAYTGPEVAAAGPVFRNANPGTLVSWCDFAIGYGPWIAPGAAGDRPFLAGHNSSYRRSALLELDRLEELLEAETVLHLELRGRGHRLVLAPGARTSHTNFGRLGVWLPVQYHCGRVFAAERSRQQWGPTRRAFYAAASPLIPCVRLFRAVVHVRRGEQARPSLIRLVPLLALGLAADGLGQLVGYVAGEGVSPRYLTGFEFRRVDHVPESDRHLWREAETHA